MVAKPALAAEVVVVMAAQAVKGAVRIFQTIVVQDLVEAAEEAVVEIVLAHMLEVAEGV